MYPLNIGPTYSPNFITVLDISVLRLCIFACVLFIGGLLWSVIVCLGSNNALSVNFTAPLPLYILLWFPALLPLFLAAGTSISLDHLFPPMRVTVTFLLPLTGPLSGLLLYLLALCLPPLWLSSFTNISFQFLASLMRLSMIVRNLSWMGSVVPSPAAFR
jgi:hypothetical protein